MYTIHRWSEVKTVLQIIASTRECTVSQLYYAGDQRVDGLRGEIVRQSRDRAGSSGGSKDDLSKNKRLFATSPRVQMRLSKSTSKDI